MSIGLVLRGGYSGTDAIAVDSGLSFKDKSKGEINERARILMVDLSEDTLGARLLAENQGGEIASRSPVEFAQEEKKQEGSYLVWRLPLSSIEGCEEIRKYRTYQVFSENELGPHPCNARAEIFYADWAREGEGAWRVFVTGGNPSPGEWCSVLIADCDSQDSTKAVLKNLQKAGVLRGPGVLILTIA